MFSLKPISSSPSRMLSFILLLEKKSCSNFPEVSAGQLAIACSIASAIPLLFGFLPQANFSCCFDSRTAKAAICLSSVFLLANDMDDPTLSVPASN